MLQVLGETAAMTEVVRIGYHHLENLYFVVSFLSSSVMYTISEITYCFEWIFCTLKCILVNSNSRKYLTIGTGCACIQ